MAPWMQALMCGMIGMGVPLLLATWELIRLRRESRRGGGWGREPAPVRPRPLPDCLVPDLPVRGRMPVKVLEPA